MTSPVHHVVRSHRRGRRRSGPKVDVERVKDQPSGAPFRELTLGSEGETCCTHYLLRTGYISSSLEEPGVTHSRYSVSQEECGDLTWFVWSRLTRPSGTPNSGTRETVEGVVRNGRGDREPERVGTSRTRLQRGDTVSGLGNNDDRLTGWTDRREVRQSEWNRGCTVH